MSSSSDAYAKALSDAAITRIAVMLSKAHEAYNKGHYLDALGHCEVLYELDAFRTDNLLLLGAIHFQLRNFSESIFYNQQCIRVDPGFAESYSNLGNALKELGDVAAAAQFYLKAIKLKPKYSDAYNNLASTYMQLGKIQEATETYQMALVLNPALVDAHSNLGNLHKASGDLEGAKRCYLEAIRIKPDFAIGWNNVAGVFKDEGQTDIAVAYYQEAIRICPLFADSYSNLGCVLRESNRQDEAMIAYETAIKLRPDFAIAHANIGACHYDEGNISKAIASFKLAIQLEPNFPDCLVNMGNALREDSRLDEALQCYRTALQLKPDHPHGWNNLANALKDRGEMKEAVHCYVTAIRLMPNFAAAHSNLGSVLKEQGKLEEALAHYHEAVTIDPLFSDGYSNMGNTYKELQQIDEAISCYKTAIKIKPNNAVALANLAAAYKDSGQLSEAIKCYQEALVLKPNFAEAFCNLIHTLLLVCDWTSREEDFVRLSEVTALELSSNKASSLPSVQPFHTLIYPFSLSVMLEISRKYALKARMNVALTDTRFTFRPKPKCSRLKIGYVSSDFGNHPLSQLMLSVFGLHDRFLFDVTCYALSAPDRSVWRSKIESDVETFKDISQLHSGDAAQLINNDGIHILINLNGYTKGSRNEIFALQPAPIQISYLGYCGTLGAEYVQYLLSDNIVTPQEHRIHYDEKIISLPHTYFVTDHKQSARMNDDENVPNRKQYGLSEDKFVFCNFNQLYKIDPGIFDVWMRLLKRVPNSVLWLLRFPPAGEENILKEALKRDVMPHQIMFSDVVPREEHVKRGFLADLFLDTPACNAHTTACDVLWSGTPLLTMMGDKMANRVGASLLRASGLDELITTSYTEYEELAAALASDTERLYAMRKHLENTRDSSPLFDTPRWVGNMETGLKEAWIRHAQGHLPDDIDVIDNGPMYRDR